jgi:homopolymeric O-antigen transport system permease protein
VTVAQQGFELSGAPTALRRLLADAWASRSLIRALGRRDFFVRYRRPTFGALWSIIVPVMQAAVLSVVFTRIVRVQTSIPFLLFVLSGVVPWTFFSSTLASAVRSITGGSGIASKVYFPRCVLPLSNVTTAFYGYVPSFVVLLVVALALRIPIAPRWLLLVPASIVLVMLTSVFALVLAALQVYFRDIAFILTAVLQAWFYGSAVFFPVTLAPEGPLRTLLIMNPATGMVELFRASFMGLHPYTVPALCWSLGWIAALAVFATVLYRRYDRVFIDLL